MQILIVSGFLGAGKTTFIKEFLKRTDKRPVIMENEYGSNNLDSLELKSSTSKTKDFKVLEFMEGCVCCTMKDSFVNSVMTIYSGLSPEYLIIEPTGVGKLSSIMENLKPILDKVMFLAEPIVVLSPHAFNRNMKEWPELYTDQIKNAGKIVFSKCENTDADIIAAVTAEIKKINPDAETVSTHYSKKGDFWWDGLFSNSGEPTRIKTDALPGADGAETFSQVSIKKGKLCNPAFLISLMEDCLRGEYGHVVRAKGTVRVNEEMLRFDLADGCYAISGSDDETAQCVFIGEEPDENKLKDRLGVAAMSKRIKIGGR